MIVEIYDKRQIENEKENFNQKKKIKKNEINNFITFNLYFGCIFTHNMG